MISFPGTLNESKSMYGASQADVYSASFDIDRLKALNLNLSVPVQQELLKEKNINAANFGGSINTHKLDLNAYRPKSTNGGDTVNGKVFYESPLSPPTPLLVSAKDYEWVYNKRAKSVLNVEKRGDSMAADIAHTSVSPSMFNSHFGVNALGLMKNVPLLNDSWEEHDTEMNDLSDDYFISEEENQAAAAIGQSLSMYSPEIKAINNDTSLSETQKQAKIKAVQDRYYNEQKQRIIAQNKSNFNSKPKISSRFKAAENLSDCSIRELCTLSKYPNSILGQARYKYADFMYCKYLGKVPNNRLITLRRFAHPVGDHIFELTNPKFIKSTYGFEQTGDVGRLISWFDTEDNKLEDIIKFSYHATWKPLQSQIEEQPGTADDSSSGIVGMIGNSLNPAYNRSVGAGQAGFHSIFSFLGSKITPSVTQGIGKNNVFLTNYDKNKVYEPKDRIQSTHIYDGALEFSNQFTLNFSYQLRGYANINPKSAFLDLIGNILEVTYRRGKFWGGARKTIGPNANMSTFKKVHSFIDDSWAKAGGFMESLINGGISLQDILGMIGRGATTILNNIKSTAESIIKGQGGEIVSKYANFMRNLWTTTGMSEGLKGYLKNAVGRPQMIAWQSLLDGGDVGLWHVTIGNPKNPIVAMGNLILDDATITQFGPLGLDDFPSELKVSVTLKHARPRDITDIGKMYTKGIESLYKGFEHHKLTDFHKMNASTAAEMDKVYAVNDVTPEAKKTSNTTNTNNQSPSNGSGDNKGNGSTATPGTTATTPKKGKGKGKGRGTRTTRGAEPNWYVEADNKSGTTSASKGSTDASKGSTTTPSGDASTANGQSEPKPELTETEKIMADQSKAKFEPGVDLSTQVQDQFSNSEILNAASWGTDDLVYTSFEDDDPLPKLEWEGRIVQSNNYSFEMIRLTETEIA